MQTSSRACVELCSNDSSSDELVGRPLFLYGCCPAHVNPLTFPCLLVNFLKRVVHAMSSHFLVFSQVHSPILRLRRTTATRWTTSFLLQDPSQHRGTRSMVVVVVSLMNRPTSRCLHLPADRASHTAQQMTCHEDAAACTRHQVAVCPDTPRAISTSCGLTIWCTRACGAMLSVVLPWPSSDGGSKGVIDEAVALELGDLDGGFLLPDQDGELLLWISKCRSSIRNHALRDVLFSAVTNVQRRLAVLKVRPSSQTWTQLGFSQRQNRMFVSSTKLGEPQANVPTI